MEQITPPSLKARLDGGDDIQLVDVREDWEFEICSITGSRHIPMQDIPATLDSLDKQHPVAVICHHGMRSQQVAIFLESNGFNQVINLVGGIDNWAALVEPEMARY